MNLKSKYDLWQMVLLKTDKEKLERMVISITFHGSGTRYCLAHAHNESWHYEQEIEPMLENKKSKAGFIQ